MALSKKDQAAVIKAGVAGGLSTAQATTISRGGSVAPSPELTLTARPATKNTDGTYTPSREGFSSNPKVYNDVLTTYNSQIGAPITTSSLSSPSAIHLPTPSFTDFSGGLASAMTGVKKNTEDEEPTEYDPATGLPVSKTGDRSQDIFQQYLSQLEAPESTADLYAREERRSGIEQKRQEVSNYSSQLNAIQAQAEADRLSLEGQGRGIPEVIIGGQQAKISREAAIKALPVAAQLAAAQGNLALAEQHLETRFRLLSEDSRNRYEYKQKVLGAVYDFATTQEKRRLDVLDKENDRKYAEEQDFNDTQNKLLLSATSQGAPRAITSAISSARTTQEAITAAGTYGAEQPNLQFVSGSDNQPAGVFNPKTGKFTATGGGGGGGGGVSLTGLTPEQQSDPFIKLLASTAGGKPITDTFAQSLNKGLNVLGQIGGLQENIKDTNTGPILGAFRGANPWDTNAQTIKAQLNAIVPNLARGVYGEVGVLTDNDIAQYSKTLPNLKSTEDIRNAVLGITVDLIGKSIKRTLEINAANQKDVSGFIDIYTEMNNTRESIFSQIPGYKGATVSLQSIGVSKEDEDIFDSVAKTTSSSGGGIGGFFSNVWKGLFGN